MGNSTKFIEYRCQCGKLLCKGQLFLSVVEIKCKRCGQIALFQDTLPVSVPHVFLVRDGEEPTVNTAKVKIYNGSRVAGYRLYVIDQTNKNLLQ